MSSLQIALVDGRENYTAEQMKTRLEEIGIKYNLCYVRNKGNLPNGSYVEFLPQGVFLVYAYPEDVGRIVPQAIEGLKTLFPLACLEYEGLGDHNFTNPRGQANPLTFPVIPTGEVVIKRRNGTLDQMLEGLVRSCNTQA